MPRAAWGQVLRETRRERVGEGQRHGLRPCPSHHNLTGSGASWSIKSDPHRLSLSATKTVDPKPLGASNSQEPQGTVPGGGSVGGLEDMGVELQNGIRGPPGLVPVRTRGGGATARHAWSWASGLRAGAAASPSLQHSVPAVWTRTSPLCPPCPRPAVHTPSPSMPGLRVHLDTELCRECRCRCPLGHGGRRWRPSMQGDRPGGSSRDDLGPRQAHAAFRAPRAHVPTPWSAA